ncbi:hypothetical protein SCHPADRAFT_350796 [Schizopora paradoxa]|uniref:DNA 3'-5' helicase n=1 Tax=Schizopora paradoxa TaxID=27342 RepID=A0A0H2RPD7_9AGAM|nr:hypothetical protein SCHPADRAFT_350796 [Schizopora paradoxa]
MVHTRRMASMVFEDLDTSTPSDQNHLGSPGAQPRSSTPIPPFPLPHTTPTTPRSHKKAGQKRLQGITELPYDVNSVKETVKSCLKLDFEIEDWQAHTIYRLLQGYDGISIAGTSYGKSIIFEGLAAMSKKKVILVVCPLKVLEKDQSAQAREKGVSAIYINEDNAKDPRVWRDVAAGVFALVYVSPEMVLSPSTTDHKYYQEKSYAHARDTERSRPTEDQHASRPNPLPLRQDLWLRPPRDHRPLARPCPLSRRQQMRRLSPQPNSQGWVCPGSSYCIAGVYSEMR